LTATPVKLQLSGRPFEPAEIEEISAYSPITWILIRRRIDIDNGAGGIPGNMHCQIGLASRHGARVKGKERNTLLLPHSIRLDGHIPQPVGHDLPGTVEHPDITKIRAEHRAIRLKRQLQAMDRSSVFNLQIIAGDEIGAGYFLGLQVPWRHEKDGKYKQIFHFFSSPVFGGMGEK